MNDLSVPELAEVARQCYIKAARAQTLIRQKSKKVDLWVIGTPTRKYAAFKESDYGSATARFRVEVDLCVANRVEIKFTLELKEYLELEVQGMLDL